MGWKEGEGLGASKQGIKSHIKVKKKFENWGVGAVSGGGMRGAGAVQEMGLGQWACRPALELDSGALQLTS